MQCCDSQRYAKGAEFPKRKNRPSNAGYAGVSLVQAAYLRYALRNIVQGLAKIGPASAGPISTDYFCCWLLECASSLC
jgi:hypothetical protein